MSLKTEIEQFTTSINSVMTHYTKDILSYLEKDINAQIKKHIDYYTVDTSAVFTIKINITDHNLIDIINDINDINICKTSKYFDFCSFTYHTNKQVFLLKEGLEQYITDFMPYWNEHIVEHYVVVGKHNFYYLKVNLPIGVIIDLTNMTITQQHNDQLNKVRYDYIKTQLDETILYVIDEINTSIKRSIVLKEEKIINIMDYLADCYTMEYTRLIDNKKREIEYLTLKQKNFINICKNVKVPKKFRVFDYFRNIRIFIHYIYLKVEQHYGEQNIKITRLDEKIFNNSQYGNNITFASHKIEL